MSWITVVFVSLSVRLAFAEPGLCTKSVQLVIGLDPTIVAASYVEAVIQTFSLNRSQTIGFNVGVTLVNLPTANEFQPMFDATPQIHAGILATQDSYQFGKSQSIQYSAFPVLATDIVIIYNLGSISQTLQLTLDQVAQIYGANITIWNDTRLHYNNVGITFPNAPVNPTIRLDIAQSTFELTRALTNASTAWAANYGTFSDSQISIEGRSVNGIRWPEESNNFYGYTDAGVAALVTTLEGSIGYVAEPSAVAAGAKFAKIQNLAGQYAFPTIDSVQATTEQIFFGDVGIQAGNASQANTYPGYLVEFTDFGFYEYYTDCCVAQEIMALAYQFLGSAAYAQQNNFVIVPDSVNTYGDTQLLRTITCGPSKTNVYNNGYLVSTAPAAASNTAEIIGIVLGVVFIVLITIGVSVGMTITNKNREREERQWNLAPGAISLPGQAQPQGTHGNRPETQSSSQTSGTAYTLGELKFPMKPAKLLEDGRYVLVHIVSLPAAKHWKSSTKMFAFDQYRHGGQMPVTVAKFIGAWSGQDSLAYYLVYEFCAKGSLHYVLKSYGVRFEEDIRYNLAFDIAEGMRYLHSKKIVHGSLSSLTCFVDANWTAKVAGWMENSIAKMEKLETFRQRQTLAKTTAGLDHITNFEDLVSLLYLEPSEDAIPHPISDVYAFGLLVLEIFTGQPPYKKDIFGAGELSINSKDLVTFFRQKFVQLCAPPPNLDDLTVPQVIKNMSLRCIGSFNRPAFDNLSSLLNEHRPVKHNIVDLMMEKMDNYVHSLEQKVEERTTEMRQLLNEMLPPQIAADLLAGRSVTPEYFECISVCFLDICGFTIISAGSSPIEVLSFLNQLWSQFDAIVGACDSYKVDTIGDAYMVCSGLPTRNGRQHVKVMCDIALAFLACAKSFRIAHRPNEQLKVRLGLNAGPAVAGVVGSKMPQYCVFGDTINTSARMEQTSEPLKIQMSDYIRSLAMSYFPEKYIIALRGEVKVKGKGMMNTYWLYGKNDSAGPAQVERFDNVDVIKPVKSEPNAGAAATTVMRIASESSLP